MGKDRTETGFAVTVGVKVGTVVGSSITTVASIPLDLLKGSLELDCEVLVLLHAPNKPVFFLTRVITYGPSVAS